MANYVLLETIELTQSAASVTFDNIPQTGYSDLKIVYSGRDTTDSPGSVYIQFNGAGYNSTTLKVNGTGSSASSSSHNNAYLGLVPGPSQTANTFSNGEIYIPNYTSSTNKSFSSDVVNENNATAAAQFLWSGLWANTAAITSVTLKTDQAFAQYSTFSLYGLAAVGTTPTVAPKATGGNIVANDGTYWYHAFLTSGTFTPQIALSCDYLVVAGGGGGGSNGNDRGSGGGGAGGYRTRTLQALTNQNYAVIIGAGGSRGITDSNGLNGSNSSFNGINTTGGGGGGRGSTPGNNGGSGGGGANGSGSGTTFGGSGNAGGYTPVEGYAGGNSINNQNGYNGAGGGGAGGVGTSATSYDSSDVAGGAGIAPGSSWASTTNTGASGYYAAGGPGAGATMTTNRSDAVTGTGNGGGGSAQNYRAGSGGSGIVIIRYAM